MQPVQARSSPIQDKNGLNHNSPLNSNVEASHHKMLLQKKGFNQNATKNDTPLRAIIQDK
jgi:hypothetical protein